MQSQRRFMALARRRVRGWLEDDVMSAETIQIKHEESLVQLIWALLAALLGEALRRSRATADPIESGFLPS